MTKKKEKTEARLSKYYEIPQKYLKKVLKLSDKSQKSEKAIDRYRLWSFIKKILPQVDTTCQYSLQVSNWWDKAFIVEIQKKETEEQPVPPAQS